MKYFFQIVIPFKDIENIRKKKTAKVIPNAIQVCQYNALWIIKNANITLSDNN